MRTLIDRHASTFNLLLIRTANLVKIMSDDKSLKVLATGFEPFNVHRVNSSWEAVKELSSLGLQCRGRRVDLEIREIKVEYGYVSKHIPQLWDDITPNLCVHVGLSPANVVKLEKFARNSTYLMPDNVRAVPSHGQCIPGGDEKIECHFDLEKIIKQLPTDVTVEESRDAGQYLCDFIYYTSLSLGKAPVLFIHVPPLNKPYSKEKLGYILKHIVEALLNDIVSCSA
jgi:pyroglutamyl-peptidase